ncbi:MAG: RagB/SusD family nutrient uptake outer membrane protein [Bacteroidales bacterium]|nr:RagB/SusD family nutrient uptake outer membrane protein [Bacteroidales bacterium]
MMKYFSTDKSNNMKRFQFAICVIILSLATPSCTDFLNEDLKGVYSTSTFFTQPEHAILGINAAYNCLLSTQSGNKPWVFGDVASDDGASGNPGDFPSVDNIDNFNIHKDNGTLFPFWELYYEGVTRCNRVLEYVPDIKMAEADKNVILGEAHFLRAWFYFNLTCVFGDIPLIDEIKPPSELNLPKSTRSEILSFIAGECETAVTLLPEKHFAADVGRATKGAAYALWAKALLFNEEWELAAEKGIEVTRLGYELMPNYKDNFDLAFENNLESIFEIQQQGETGSPTGNAYGQWFAPREGGTGGYAFNTPTQNFVDEFERDGDYVDCRLNATVVQDQEPWGDTVFSANWSATGYVNKKYNVEFSSIKQDETNGPRLFVSDTDLNFTPIRYADILLVIAEALNEDDRTAEAVPYINLVRERARNSHPQLDELPETFMAPLSAAISKTSLRDAIRHERRVELGFEFHRYYDIIRYGESYANEALSEFENFDYETHKYFPIPQNEIDINPLLSNN